MSERASHLIIGGVDLEIWDTVARNGIGAPAVAGTVAAMTDTSKVYVYTGSESGYTAGNWYYYNGSAWVSGGVYNSTAFETDETLTVEGAAADAKAAGDRISALEEGGGSENKAGILRDTATGNVVTIVPDATVENLLEASVELEPIQDLHGYDHPWAAGAGTNKCAFPSVDFTLNGVRYYTENGTLHMSGTSQGETSSADPAFDALHFKLPAGTYYFSRFTYPNAAYLAKVADTTAIVTNNGSFTLSEETDMRVGFYVYNKTFSGEAIPLSVTVGSTAPSAYTPAANICPISGHTGATLNVTGKNLLDPAKKTEDTSARITWYGDVGFLMKGGTTYTLKEFHSGEEVVTMYIQNLDGDTLVSASTSVSYTPSADELVRFRAYRSPALPSNIDFMLVVGSAPSSFVPYNPSSAQYPVTFPQTVYGGTFDWVSGKLTIEWFLYVYDGTEPFSKSGSALNGFYNNLYSAVPPHSWPKMLSYARVTPTYEACNMFKITSDVNEYKQNYGMLILDSGMNFDCDPAVFGTTVASFQAKLAELYAAGTPLSVVAKIVTPVEIDLTPEEVETLTGEINLWSDAGEVSVEYAADLKHYIDSKIAAAVAAMN